jgi:hypothetical protein
VTWTQLDSGAAATASAGSGYTYSYPGGAPAAGDLLILGVSAATTVSTPSGWTLSSGASAVAGLGGYVFWRVAGASEPSSVTVTTSGNHAATIGFLRYSGGAAAPFDTAANATVDGSAGSGSQPASITLASTGELLVAFSCMGYSLNSSDATSPAWNDSITSQVASVHETVAADSDDTQIFGGTLTGASGTIAAAACSWSTVLYGSRYTILLGFLPSAGLGIVTTQLPAATEGAPYSTTLAATGGSAPYTWSISAGSLPGWASLNASTGVISGTAPGSPQVTSFTAKVTDAVAATATQDLVLPVGPYPAGQPPGGPWALAFNDDFAVSYPTRYGTGPNPDVWADHLNLGDQARTNTGECSWAPHGYYGQSVTGSVLTLTAAYQGSAAAVQAIDPACPNPMPNGNTPLYTSGMASSHPGFSATYGYFEAYCSNVQPAGFWPAFWMIARGGPAYPPEIDIDEWYPGNPGQVHEGYLSTSAPFVNNFIAGDQGNYHAYGMRLDSSHVTWFYDGVQQFQTAYTDGALAWIVMLFATVQQGTNTGTGWPASFSVDYCRFWTVQGVPAQPVISSVSPPGGIPSSGTVTVSFPAVPGAASYRVTAMETDLYADTGSFSYLAPPPATASGASSPLTVGGLTNGAEYNFTVAAINATGYSIESLPVPPLGPPASPAPGLPYPGPYSRRSVTIPFRAG